MQILITQENNEGKKKVNSLNNWFYLDMCVRESFLCSVGLTSQRTEELRMDSGAGCCDPLDIDPRNFF